MKSKCKKCGVLHGMGIEDTSTGSFEPIDLCYDCIFKDCRYEPIEEQIVLRDSVDLITDREMRKQMSDSFKRLIERASVPIEGFKSSPVRDEWVKIVNLPAKE
jgi:hypothetical protein